MKLFTRKLKSPYADMRDAFFEELYYIAKKDRNVILLMADQGAMSFEKFRRDIPSQFINVGISEQNMVSVAAGLTLGGKRVFVHAITTFLTLRCYEQIKVDVSIMNLPVTFVGVGAGFTYGNDGPTHHSNQDIAIMRAIPGMTIYNASDTVTTSAFPYLAYQNSGPTYVRFDKERVSPLYSMRHNFQDGIGKLKNGKDCMIISTGVMVHKALEIAKRLEREGISAGVIDVYRLKPFNEKKLFLMLNSVPRIVIIEEHSAYGGLGTLIADFLCDYNLRHAFQRFGLKDAHCFEYGDREYMHQKVELDIPTVVERIIRFKKTRAKNA